MGVSDWFASNWFDLLQTVGIVGGLLFTAYAIRRNEKALRISNLLAVKQAHQEIWSKLYERPELSRILNAVTDLNLEPVSIAEVLFVNSLILHLGAVFQAIEDDTLTPMEGLRTDIRNFFSLPIPKFVWQRNRQFQNTDFVEFVETC